MKYQSLFLATFFSLLTYPICNAAPYETEWYEKPIRTHFFEIKNSAEFDGLVHLINEQNISFETDTINIVSDLDLNGIQSISSFNGHIIGNNHTISNLNKPLISTIAANGVVENLIFDSSCKISTGSDLGVVSSICSGIIKKCISYASVTCYSSDYFRAGGICGNLSNGKIIGCTNYGKITGTVPAPFSIVMRIGGICGYIGNEAKVIGCSNYGDIKASSYAYAIAGGIVGDSQSNSLIENCINNGIVNSTITGMTSLTSTQIIQYTGGIAGQMQFGGNINMCTNLGDVSNNTQYVAGIVGHAGKSSIMNCANHADITSVEDSYFSCACGICSDFDGVSLENNYVFANCINTGQILSKTKNAIATAAGISNEIKYATVANLLNTGSVNASSYGSLSAEFSIPQYETSNCNILSTISSIEEANTFIDDYTGNLNFVKWYIDEDNQINLSNSFSHFLEVFEGCAEIYCFSNDPSSIYTLSFINHNHNDVVFSNEATIYNLTPSTEYQYLLSSENSNHTKSGSFNTSNIIIKLNIDSIFFTKAILNIDVTARGCKLEKIGVKYRKSDSSKWDYIYGTDTFISLTNLEDNTEYDIKPICIIMGSEYEGDYYSLTTKELIPDIFKSGETSSSFSFETSNQTDLIGYDYGILLNDVEYRPDSDGIFTLTDLSCDKNYSIYSFIYKQSKRFIYHIGDFSLINFETGESIQVSSSAAMVKVRVGAKKMQEYPYHEYNDYKVEVKCITDPDETNVIPDGLTPIYTGNTYEYCVTFKCPQSQLYQYRLRVGTTRKYESKYDYLYGEWKTVDPQSPNVQVVEPLFTNFNSTINNNNVTISCSNVPGEENINSSGLEYRLSSSEEYINIALTSKNGILSKTFTSLVPGYEYVGRFYNTVNNHIYYSPDFIFNSNGDIILGNIEPPISDDENLKLSILYPENGIIHQMVSYYKDITFHLSTPSGWYINSIFFNGIDITYNCTNRQEADISTGPITKDSNIAVSFCKYSDGSTNPTIDDIQSIKVYSVNNAIYLKTTLDLPFCTVYDVSGKTVFSGISERIEVPIPGVYMVKTDKFVYKLLVNF